MAVIRGELNLRENMICSLSSQTLYVPITEGGHAAEEAANSMWFQQKK